MSFGNKAESTKKYVYGAKVNNKVPFEGFEEVNEQMFLANQFQHELINIELQKRQEYRKVIEDKYPQLVLARNDIEILQEEINLLRKELKKKNSINRVKNSDEILSEKIKAKVVELKKKWKDFNINKKILLKI